MAKKDGEIRIKRRDGRIYVLNPLQESRSPLDVEGIDSGFTKEGLNSIVRERRERYTP